MADSSKTEKATPKKRRDERKKGNIFFSNDAVSVVVLLASFFVLKLTATPMVQQIYRFLQYAMGLVAGAAHTELQDNLSGLVLEMLKTFLLAAGPLLATTAVAAVAATFFQTKLLVSGEALRPKFSRISPLQGIKRLFSLRSVIEALKGILKITVLLFLIYQFLVGIVDTFTKYLHTDLAVACAHLVDESFQMVMQIAIAFVVLAGADVFYQWWDYERQLRMSKQENQRGIQTDGRRSPGQGKDQRSAAQDGPIPYDAAGAKGGCGHPKPDALCGGAALSPRDGWGAHCPGKRTGRAGRTHCAHGRGASYRYY